MPQTGATRYQKFLKSEKSKTKLKAKKDLPKGTNITKTKFKVKKIVITEQLKKHADTEVLSSRKLSVDELVSRLNHFNTNSITDALQGLKELIKKNPEVLEQHLGRLINSVTPLLLKVENVIRKDTLQVLNIILTNVTAEKIEPFYDTMSTYLRCAMTHIDTRIQEDSLQFLDILLLCAPVKVANDFYKIIPNFLDMISKLKADSKPGRTLTINLGSKTTTVKWRVKVLHRLQDYLTKFIQQENINAEHVVTDTTKELDHSKSNHHPLFNPNYTEVCHLSCFSPKKPLASTPVNEMTQLMEYINTLMPLLFETWLEVCPNISGEKIYETVISEEAAMLLNHTLEVISLLSTLVSSELYKKTTSYDLQTTFSQKYSEQFTQHFVKMFPFIGNIRSKQKNEKTEFEHIISDPKLVTENLKICHLYILLNPNINKKRITKHTLSVLAYIERTFSENSQDDINDFIMTILDSLFSKKANSWTDSLRVMESLLNQIIWSYCKTEMSSSFKQQIFKLLGTIAMNDSLVHFHSCSDFELWLHNAPNILLQSTINMQTVDIIHKLAVRHNNIFNNTMRFKLSKIVENLPALKIVDAVSDTSYYKLYSLFYWIKHYDEDFLDKLETQLCSGLYKVEHMTYIIDILKIKQGAVVLAPCDADAPAQRWRRRGALLRHGALPACLDAARDELALAPCDDDKATQHFSF